MFPRTFASEFPHDNPALSEGVTWLCPAVCAPPLPCAVGVLVRAQNRLTRASVAERAERSSEPVQPAESAPRGPGLRRVRAASPSEVGSASAVEKQPESAFERFVAAMVRTALDQGATQVAAELPIVLGEGRLRAWMFDSNVQRALQTRGYLAPDGGGASAAFSRAAEGWRSVLQGGSGDLSACGDKTLDEWGSALLASLLGRAPQSAEDLRRALRLSGVAAFGMREAA